MAKVQAVDAYWVLDSRGRPTVCGEVITSDNITAYATVASGASIGEKEALELRDGEKEFLGFGVSKAIDNVKNVIASNIVGLDIFEQKNIDEKLIELDGTNNKNKLGANAILAVSLAVAKAAALSSQLPLYKYFAQLFGEENPYLLPLPIVNMLEGGAHAKTDLDFQEFLLVPTGAKNFSQGMQMAAEIYGYLGEMIKIGGLSDEGGYVITNFKSTMGTEKIKEAIELLISAISKAGYKTGQDVAIALDAAANHFHKEGKYQLFGGQNFSSEELLNFYQELVKDYPLICLEDGMAENDINGWKILTESLGSKIQLVGDDLFDTNPKIFADGISQKLANAIVVKPNQIGTISETLEVIKMAKDNSYKVVIANRSGETEDTSIADLAVGTRAGQIKSGSVARSERTAKYNRLIKIERELGEKAEFAGNLFVPTS